jgi:hypothetical protein
VCGACTFADTVLVLQSAGIGRIQAESLVIGYACVARVQDPNHTRAHAHSVENDMIIPFAEQAMLHGVLNSLVRLSVCESVYPHSPSQHRVASRS